MFFGIQSEDKEILYKKVLYEKNVKEKLFWKDIDLWSLEYENISVEIKEKVEQYGNALLVIQMFQIWSDKAKQVAWWVWLQSIRNDADIINEKVNEIEISLWNILNKISKWESIQNDKLNYIFEKIKEAESQEWIVDDTFEWDTRDIQKIIFDNTKSFEDKQFEMFENLRDGFLDDGNSEKVKDNIADRLLKKKEFEDIDTLLTDKNNLKQLFGSIEKWNIQDLKNTTWLKQGQADEIIEKYKDLQQDIEKQKDNITQMLIKQNPQIANDSQKKDLAIKLALETIVNHTMIVYMKNVLITNRIEQNWLKWKWDRWIDKYADISWIWMVDMSDANKSLSGQLLLDVAMMFVPLWVWVVAARATYVWAKAAYNSFQLSRIGSQLTWLQSISKISWVKRLSQVWVEWLWFYEWYQMTNNLIYQESLWKVLEESWNWVFDWKEIAKSIWFIWTMRALWPILWRLNIIKIDPNKQVKYETMKKILNEWVRLTATWWAMGMTWVWIEAISKLMWDENAEIHITWKKFVELVILAGMFKGVWKLEQKYKEYREKEKNEKEESEWLYEELPYLQEHKVMLWVIRESDILWLGTKWIVVRPKKKFLRTQSVVKIGIDEEGKMRLVGEYEKHRVFRKMLKNWNFLWEIPGWIKIPDIQDPPTQNSWYFSMDLVNWQSLQSKYLKKSFHEFLKTESNIYLDRLTDFQLKQLLVKKYWQDKYFVDMHNNEAIETLEMFYPEKVKWFQKTLDYLKTKGIRHKDLHDGNIMVDKSWNIYIIDFDSIEIIKK